MSQREDAMWLLETPFSPGDLDPGKAYTHLKIAHTEHSNQNETLRVHLRRGYVDDGWHWAKVGDPDNPMVFTIEDDLSDPETPKRNYGKVRHLQVKGSDAGKGIDQLEEKAIFEHLAAEGLIGAGSFAG